MKRPFCYACLFFLLFIGLFYVCFPPIYPEYPELEGRKVYAGGRIISKQWKEVEEMSCVVYTLDQVRIEKNSAATLYNSKRKLSRVSESILQNQQQSENTTLQNNQQSENITFQNNQSLENQQLNNQYSKKNNPETQQRNNEKAEYHHKKIYCYAAAEGVELDIGAYVWMEGVFEGYHAPDNPGQFDSQQYYHMLGIGGGIRDAALIWCDGRRDILQESLFDLKQYLLEKTDTYYTEKYSGVMKTILLGDKTNLNPGMKELFKEGGLLHILSISGMHISMIGMSTYKLLRKMRLSVKFSAVVGLGLVLLYGMMVGSGAATFRAIVMFAMQMAAILLGRTYDRMTGLAVAAVLLLLEQPMYVFSSGFLLSFVTVLGIIIFPPLIDQFCREKGAVLAWCSRLLGGSIGALLASFPIQLYFFYEYPLYSMLVNVVVLPFLPYIMWFGAAVLVIPGVIRIVVLPLVYSIEMIIWGYEWVCEKSRMLPFHSLVFGAPAWWQMAVYYICLVAVIVLVYKRDALELFFQRNNFQRDRKSFRIYKARKDWLPWRKLAGAYWKIVPWIPGTTILCIVWIAFGILLWRPSHGIAISFLSVGQGDCAVVQNDNAAYVIDCGSSRQSNVGTKILLPFLKSEGIAKVEGIFLSHADADHISGILGWLTEYEHSHVKIGRIILPALREDCLESEFAEVIALAAEKKIPISTLGAGDRLDLGKLRIKVLYPQKNFADVEDRNGYSQVLLLEHAGQSVLFTGDIGEEQEKVLQETLQEELKKIVLLKAAHHGSRFSSSEHFLEMCRPKHGVFSYGVGNSYGHPHGETVERLEAVGTKLWYTGRQGAIMVEWGEEFRIKGWKRR